MSVCKHNTYCPGHGLEHDVANAEIPERGTYRGVTASRHERRAMGQRAGRKPRRRELPGAEARRIDRNKTEAWGVTS